jgi:glycosyltransferase involved in cell wall biosynthesis
VAGCQASVIVPAYNCEAYLGEAIESILSQTRAPLEVIVVDDGSTDGSGDVASRFLPHIRYARQTNRGPAAARNCGFGMARGSVICFLDADDRWQPDALDVQLSYLESNPLVDIVIGQTRMFRQIGIKEDRPDFEYFPVPMRLSIVSSMAVRRRAFDRIGLFDESMPQSEDTDWFLRAKEQQIPTLVHQNVVHLYRRHSANVTNQKELRNHFFLRAVKLSLDRRRAR